MNKTLNGQKKFLFAALIVIDSKWSVWSCIFKLILYLILICNEISGTGVFVTKSFAPGAFLLKYPGDLIS